MTTAYETLSAAELEQFRACALGEEIALGEIESRFQQLWDQDDAATRASLMNFSIYNEQLGALLENTAMISQITLEHACRALLIMCLPEKEEARLRAWITAHCQLDANGRKIACSEQIAFLVEGNNPDLIRNIVFSHLDSDLPLVLWWQGEFTDRFEEHLYTSIDRLLIDSDETTTPLAFYNVIVRAIRDDKSRFTVHDLAWARSYHSRLSLASIFDDPAARSHIEDFSTVRIGHAPEHRSSALLLLAWLATQSKWSLCADQASGDSIAFSDARGRTIAATIESVAHGAPLDSLELAGERFTLSMHAEADSPYLRATWTADGNEHSQMFPAGATSSADLVTEQLARGGANRLFLKILDLYLGLLTEGC